MLKWKKITAATLAVSVLGMTPVLLEAQRVGGRANFEAIVSAHSTNVYHMEFYGGATARIEVDGDNDTDLDVYVYNEYGQLVASDTDELDLCIVRWTPRRTGLYRIEVVNLGGVYNRFTLQSN
jgi:hypothetical protein